MTLGAGPGHKMAARAESETERAEKTHKMVPKTKNLGEGDTRSLRLWKTFCSFLGFFCLFAFWLFWPI